MPDTDPTEMSDDPYDRHRYHNAVSSISSLHTCSIFNLLHFLTRAQQMEIRNQMTKEFKTVLHRTPFVSNQRLAPYRSRTRRARSLCRKSKSSATSPARSQHTKATTNASTRTTTKKRRTLPTQKGNTGLYYCVGNYYTHYKVCNVIQMNFSFFVQPR